MTEEQHGPETAPDRSELSPRQRQAIEIVLWVTSPVLLLLATIIVAAILGAPLFRASLVFALVILGVGSFLMLRPQSWLPVGRLRSGGLIYAGLGALTLAFAALLPTQSSHSTDRPAVQAAAVAPPAVTPPSPPPVQPAAAPPAQQTATEQARAQEAHAAEITALVAAVAAAERASARFHNRPVSDPEGRAARETLRAAQLRLAEAQATDPDERARYARLAADAEAHAATARAAADTPERTSAQPSSVATQDPAVVLYANGTMLDWHNSSAPTRLMTARIFTLRATQLRTIRSGVDPQELYDCLNNAYTPAANRRDIGEVAAGCMTLMGWVR